MPNVFTGFGRTTGIRCMIVATVARNLKYNISYHTETIADTTSRDQNDRTCMTLLSDISFLFYRP